MLFTVIRIVFYILASFAILFAFIFFLRAIVARAKANKQVYGVARQNERQHMMLYGYYSVGCLIIGLIFFGVGSLTFLDGADEATVEEATPLPLEATTEVVEPLETSTPTTEPEAPTATATTAVDIATTEPEAPEAPPTVDTGSPTPAAAETVVVEQPSNQQTAVVNSPVVGLYLRVVPSGEILERLEDQAIVTLLGETQNVDNIEWVKVASINGNEGWVAADYLLTESTP